MLKNLLGRPAAPASGQWNLLKTFVQTLVFWSVFLFLIPALIWQGETVLGLTGWWFDPGFLRYLGYVLFALGGTLGLVSGAVMAVHGRGTPLPVDAPRELVVRGPYRFVRNPMAIAGLSQGVAVGLVIGSPLVILYACCGGPVWNSFVRPWEELDLAQRFGEPYRHYRESVRCWLPRCTPYEPTSGPESPGKTDATHAEREHA